MSKDIQEREKHFLEQYALTKIVFNEFQEYCLDNKSHGKHKVTIHVKAHGLCTVHVLGLRKKLTHITAYIAQTKKLECIKYAQQNNCPQNKDN